MWFVNAFSALALFAPPAQAAPTRRSFLVGLAAIAMMRGPVIPKASSLPTLEELSALNRYDFESRAIRSVTARAGIFDWSSTSELFYRFMEEVSILVNQPNTELYIRHAFPHLNGHEVVQLVDVYDYLLEEDVQRALANSARHVAERAQLYRQRAAWRAEQDDTERCAKRLTLPDVLRVWEFGPDLGRPLKQMASQSDMSAPDVSKSEPLKLDSARKGFGPIIATRVGVAEI